MCIFNSGLSMSPCNSFPCYLCIRLFCYFSLFLYLSYLCLLPLHLVISVSLCILPVRADRIFVRSFYNILFCLYCLILSPNFFVICSYICPTFVCFPCIQLLVYLCVFFPYVLIEFLFVLFTISSFVFIVWFCLLIFSSSFVINFCFISASCIVCFACCFAFIFSS